ncbi:uncharacterized protein [Venturia canescens]|uniref:uncharacterized protein n=1 Tax=Venturia canescens TaxID=32260 RepID=UPI001C9C8C29|nr:uncharacterized protein LOC122405711 [Venturia canescens]XP_043266549.1 uncharacterized protein LOC122405711 [Venturia canescens]
MPHPCVVCGRSRMNPNNREEDYMFFGFPVNYEERCRKWLEFCCREDLYKLTKKQLLQRMVCSKHFEKKDFLNEYQDRLNCTGVPSVYDPSQSLYNITCVLCGRSRKDPPDSDYDGTTFHHFPGEEFRCLKWLDFVGIDSYYRLTRKEILYCYICSNHFEKSQFMPGFKARLCDNAVPSIYLKEETDEFVPSPCTTKGTSNTRLSQISEKNKKYEPLSNEALESQACAACGRSRSDPRNKSEGYKFHPFPAYEIGRCLRWCQFLGREDLLKMSPNQIRKLVLCSKHFLSGQSFHKIGPCDAVPTIKDVDEIVIEKMEIEIDKYEQEENDEEDNTEMRLLPVQDSRRPMVSSKKPKIENKPAPLAKKRGRSKRPTSINIPKIDHLNIENRVSKVPIPAANWKIQFANNQFQPLTIANTNTSPNMAITTDGKKVILPFTGNISNLGAPIPVHSLSSMPPGFLIKINLPEQHALNKKPIKTPRKQPRRKKAETDIKGGKVAARSKTNIEESNNLHNVEDIFTPEPQSVGKTEPEFYECHLEEREEEMIPDVIEVLDEDYVDMTDSYVVEDEEGEVHVYQEITGPEIPAEKEEIPKVTKLKKRSQRKSMSDRTRRTIMPIRTEVRQFLHKLKPHMRRLPRKAKAQLKLSIVNLVIDRL